MQYEPNDKIVTTTGITPCVTCDFVHLDTRKLSHHRWMCVKFPRLDTMSPLGVTLEPYNRAININLGYCPLWTARRNGKQEEQNAVES